MVNDMSTVIGITAIVIALLTAGILLWQTRFATRVQALLQCDSEWRSDKMCSIRRKAASALLSGESTADVDRLLDFFETIAGLFVKRHGLFRVLPDRWARHTFYWPAVCYWSKSRDYIDDVRSMPTQQAAWKDLCELMHRWTACEGAPSAEDVQTFLTDEKNA